MDESPPAPITRAVVTPFAVERDRTESASDALMPEMTPEESSALERSAETIRHIFAKCVR
jgi:hypothetical protein